MSVVLILIVNSKAKKHTNKNVVFGDTMSKSYKILMQKLFFLIIIIALSTSSHVKEFPSDDVRRSSIIFAVTRHYQSLPEQIYTSFQIFNRLGL